MSTMLYTGCLQPEERISFLRATDVVDWQHPAITALADLLAARSHDHLMYVRTAFEWVRDNIQHTHDFNRQEVTCTASEVLKIGAGLCYAKSHLLAAMLRAKGIPAGLCYQRLRRDGNENLYCLHGLNAVYLPGTHWYRIDPRGNKAGVNALFTPPFERLAWSVTLPGEADLPQVYPDPLPEVMEALARYRTMDVLWQHLPDVDMNHVR